MRRGLLAVTPFNSSLSAERHIGPCNSALDVVRRIED
jgi:hypothetical protein